MSSIAHSLVTGANRGLGLEFARQLLARGRRVVATCRQPGRATALNALAGEHPGRLRVLPLDVADARSRAELVRELPLLAGDDAPLRIDLLVNNAGVLHSGERFGHVSEANLLDSLRINAVGPFLLVQELAPLLADGARVADLSSQLGSIGRVTRFGTPSYAISKAAQNMATAQLAQALASRCIPAGCRPKWAAPTRTCRRRIRRRACSTSSGAWEKAKAAGSSTGAASRCPGDVARPPGTPMFDVILHAPEIPPNTGNVIRLCANTGARLHLVEPLGFALDDRQLRRAGLDYHEYTSVRVHASLDAALAEISPARLFALSTRGAVRYDTPRYREGDAFLFGSETRGLPGEVLDAVPADLRLRLPMRPDNRSLNLSNAVAVVVFEAWRQQGFDGGA